MRLLALLAFVLVPCRASGQSIPVVSDDFNSAALDASKWTAITSGIPRASVVQAGGVLTLANKAYLRSNAEVDPVALGTTTVRGLWRWTAVASDVGTLEVLTRTSAVPDAGQFWEATDGLEFNLWLGPSYTGVAVIHARTPAIAVGANTVSGSLHWTPYAWYEFEAIDTGTHASWTVRETADHSNAVVVTCDVSPNSQPLNYVAIHGREYIGSDSVCDLDDFAITVADCNGNLVADGTDIASGQATDCDADRMPDSCQIAADASLDLNTNGVLDGCECGATTYCVGAPNSVGPGARMSYAGTLSRSLNNLTLLCSGLPPNAAGIFFFGPVQASVPFGNGYRCVGGAITRTGVTFAGPSGFASRAFDLQHPSAGAPSIAVGSSWNFQFWYRNPAGGGAGFNLSDGLALRMCQ